tara:strand:+ start:5179 stop:5397 length:219 start_codon:yes stop_codon:yes gene_type:complete
MSASDVEKAALALPESELIDLVDRLYHYLNRPDEIARAERVKLADERERASENDPEGDSDFDQFLDELKQSV